MSQSQSKHPETGMPIDPEKAFTDPSLVYSDPQDVLVDPQWSPPQKLKILRRWEQDARELTVAEAENMTGGEPNRLRAVLKAIQSLESGGEATPE